MSLNRVRFPKKGLQKPKQRLCSPFLPNRDIETDVFLSKKDYRKHICSAVVPFSKFLTFAESALLFSCSAPGEGAVEECERKPPSPVPGPLPLPAFSLGRKIKGICWLLWLPLIGISGFRAVYSASSKAGEDIYSCLWQILTFFQAFREKSQRHFMKTAGAFDFFRQLTWILS